MGVFGNLRNPVIGPFLLGSVLLVTALTPQAAQRPTASEATPEVPVLIAAGDIASCRSNGDEATADLLDGIEGTIATLGDNVYDSGTAEEFAECYDPTWGRHKARTRPAPGNHDFKTNGGSDYFAYFGAAAGEPGQGWYSYELAAWHIIVLNSNCQDVGGCDPDSRQAEWLRTDLAGHPRACTLAYWHHPRFSSGSEHGNHERVEPFWDILYEAGADVVLAGHEHNYERFAPQAPTGEADRERGIRQFVVGTGGNNHYGFDDALQPNSEARDDDAFGVLTLTLHATSYDWLFAPAAGEEFADFGSGACH